MEHVGQIFVKVLNVVGNVFILTLYGFVNHDSLGRVTEHLSHIKVEGTHTIRLFESKMGIARTFTHYVHRSTFALSNLTHMVDVFFLNEETHTLLTFVGNDFLCRKCLVADGEVLHIDNTTAFFHQLRETVYVTCRTVVVDRNNGVYIFFTKGTHQVIRTLLHFGIRTLYGIEFDT